MLTCDNLVLVVTCKPGKEDIVELQLGDSIYPLDPNVKIVHTSFTGLLLVYSKIEPWKAFWLTMVNPIAGASRIVPVEKCIITTDLTTISREFEKFISEKVAKRSLRCVNLEVFIRGNVFGDDVKKLLKDILYSNGISLKYKAEYDLKVEIINSMVIFTLMPRRSDRISHRIRLMLSKLKNSSKAPSRRPSS